MTATAKCSRNKAGRPDLAARRSDGAAPVKWWRHPRVVLALIVAAGALLRLYRFDALSLWLDEGITVHVTRHSWATVLGFHGAYETHPPLSFVLVKLTTLAVPEQYAGRVVSIVAGTATIPVLYALASRILGTWPALVASAALAISPLHIWYSREARMYALSVLLVTTSYLALVAFHQSPRRTSAVVYGLAVLSAMYANYGSVYTLVPQVVLLAMATRKHGRDSLLIWSAGVAAAVAFLPWLPALLGTTTSLGMSRQGYLGVSLEKIWASVVSIVGVGGAGSYFWGSSPTPWERWPWAHPILLLALSLTVVAGGVALARRLESAIVVLGLLPGTLAVAAILSLVSPGYADRSVLAAVVGWALVLGALASDRLAVWLKVAGWTGAVFTVLISLVTLRAIYVGGDKQHWAELASQTAVAARFGNPVWTYPTYAATLIDVYQPTVLALSKGVRDSPNRAIGHGGDAPSSKAEAIWVAYMDVGGIERLQRQLTERAYERLMHRYYWHPLYLDLYVKAGIRPGREIPINGRFEKGGVSVGEWQLHGGTASFSPSDTGGRIFHLADGTPESAIVTSAPARAERLYLVDLDARLTSSAGRLRAFVVCASGSAWLEVAPDGGGASVPTDGRWHRVSVAAICPRGTERVIVDIRNAGPGELMIRDVALREVAPVDGASTAGRSPAPS